MQTYAFPYVDDLSYHIFLRNSQSFQWYCATWVFAWGIIISNKKKKKKSQPAPDDTFTSSKYTCESLRQLLLLLLLLGCKIPNSGHGGKGISPATLEKFHKASILSSYLDFLPAKQPDIKQTPPVNLMFCNTSNIHKQTISLN